MKKRLFLTLLILCFIAACHNGVERRQSAMKVRGLADTIGFSHTPEQISAIVALSESAEREAIQLNRRTHTAPWIAGICPHDDHLLAGRVYVHLFGNLKAKRYVIFGVAHKARNWGVQDSLIFDAFDAWRGPYGNVGVSDLRRQLQDRLSNEIFTINNDWQSQEHSVEGIVPFIQHFRQDAEIVSILVPYMDWERISRISEELGAAFADIIQEKKWILGEDLAFIFSNDGDHYGDQDWDGADYADFGSDERGYSMATKRDRDLIAATLTGELRLDKLKRFCETVWGDDLRSYKIRWCGRFAIPLGLSTLQQVCEKLGQATPAGYLLRYDTSYGLGTLPTGDIGIGTTAPNHIRHWVGYSAIGYR